MFTSTLSLRSMESDSKRRSGSFGSQKAAKDSNGDDSMKLSLSEGSIVDKDASVSPGSSEASGTLKKPRRFKPRKFIAKRFKSKKSDDQDQNTAESGQSEQETSKRTSVVSKLSEKLGSPKLPKFNFVKRFSGKKSYKVSPIEDGADDAKSNLRRLESLSLSESSIVDDVKATEAVEDDNVSEPSTSIVSFEEREVEEVSTSSVSQSTNKTSMSKETVTLESKKVTMKITISGKKVEKRGVPSPNAVEQSVDMASQRTQLPIEPSQTHTDIILPSTTTQARLSTNRQQFFSVWVPPPPPSDSANIEQGTKPISNGKANETPESFATVVKEGLSVKSTQSAGSTEVEKYLILTSSLNTIISAAKELDDLNGAKDLKFPQLPELKIHEGTSEPEVTEEELFEKNIDDDVSEGLSEASGVKEEIKFEKIAVDDKPLAEEVIDIESLRKEEETKAEVEHKPEVAQGENKIKTQSVRERIEIYESATQSVEDKFEQILAESQSEVVKISQILASSTPLKAADDQESDDMKKNARKSKIPVERRRLSASSGSAEKEATSTVRTQEAYKPYHLNLSSSSSEELKELKADEIKFEVGTPVRPQRTSPAVSSQNLAMIAPLATPESPSVDDKTQESIDEIFHSPEISLPLESTRRKIAFVPQLTIYTPEEQELLKSNFQANASDSVDVPSLPPDSSMFPVFDDSVVRKLPFCPQLQMSYELRFRSEAIERLLN